MATTLIFPLLVMFILFILGLIIPNASLSVLKSTRTGSVTVRITIIFEESVFNDILSACHFSSPRRCPPASCRSALWAT